MKQSEPVSARLKCCFYGLLSLGVSFGAITCKNSTQLSSAPIHACDHLAADPEDPGRHAKVTGVRSENLAVEANVLAAISVCTEAHEKYPDVPRFAYQLGRVLAAGGLLEEAQPFLISAAEAEYAAAFALLGDLSDEQEEAEEFYRISAERGYGPAKRFLEQATKSSATRGTEPVKPTSPQPGAQVAETPLARTSPSQQLQSTAEPSEAEMIQALKSKFQAINEEYHDLKNSCERRDFRNNPILAVQCLELYGGTGGSGEIAFQLTHFEKLRCSELGENYYWCEFIAKISSSNRNLQNVFSQLMRGGSTGQGRFLRRSSGWIFMSMEE